MPKPGKPTTAWDTAKVGDDHPGYHGASVLCSAESSDEPLTHVLGGYGCTRPDGHDGQHVATDAVGVLAVWPPK